MPTCSRLICKCRPLSKCTQTPQLPPRSLFFRVFSDNKLYPQGGVRPCLLLQEPFIYSGNGSRSIRFVHLKKSKKGRGFYEAGDVFRMGNSKGAKHSYNLDLFSFKLLTKRIKCTSKTIYVKYFPGQSTALVNQQKKLRWNGKHTK